MYAILNFLELDTHLPIKMFGVFFSSILLGITF